MRKQDSKHRILPCLAAIPFAFVIVSCETTPTETRFSELDRGETVTRLPKRYKPIEIDGMTYYKYFGKYYVKRGGQYVVTTPPLSSLPEKRAISYRTLYRPVAEIKRR